MSQISLTEFFPGDAFDATAINNALTSWNTASASIDGSNVREEGLTRRVIVQGAIQPPAMRDSYTNAGPVTLTTSATPTMIAFGGTVAKVGPLSYDKSNGDMLLVRLSCRFKINSATTPKEPELGLYLYYGLFANDAAADASVAGDWTKMTSSDRFHELSTTYNGTYGNVLEYNCCTVHAPFLVGAGYAETTLYFAAFYSLDDPDGTGPTAVLEDLHMHSQGWAR